MAREAVVESDPIGAEPVAATAFRGAADVARVDLTTASLDRELALLDDPQDRSDARVLAYQTASAEVVGSEGSEGSDDAARIETLSALRDRVFLDEGARRDAQAVLERAWAEGAHYTPSDEDRRIAAANPAQDMVDAILARRARGEPVDLTHDEELRIADEEGLTDADR